MIDLSVGAPYINLVYTPHRYTHYLAIMLEITNITELAVGGSAIDMVLGSGVTENPIAKMPMQVKYGDDIITEIVPYIPGSTVKGVIRSYIELKLRQNDIDGNRYVSLGELLEKTFSTNGIDSSTVSEILDKVLKPILYEYFDENIVDSCIRRLREKAIDINDLIRYLGRGTEVIELFDEIVKDEAIARTYADMFRTILNRYVVNINSCDSVVEGLVCTMPIPKYKFYLVKGLVEALRSKSCTIDNIEYPCRVCRIFGAPGYSSKAIVFDAYPIAVKNITILYRTHIAIDRIRGAVAQGKTFDIEYIAPGARFISILVYYFQAREEKDQKQNSGKQDKRQCNKNLMKEFNEILEKHSMKLVYEEKERNNIELLLDSVEELSNRDISIGRRKTIGMGLIKLRPLALSIWRIYNPTKIDVCYYIDENEFTKIMNEARSNGLPVPLEELITTFFMNKSGGEQK
ncbi:protein of unknown function DUF324 [Ignisphaera aggregans DSM 17230]|uniref:CRISPR type III-associated protein domain-containing protein n=1 Tax=Ignisphaera aggregans (strain DSM 17230 / JCM 13409 / AQ1.S1) TaxID=583356 RepID=E0SSH7_IGNAA|nr:protein of unknown function DUF324 [Ignisphaera aggregans DSM 17230]